MRDVSQLRIASGSNALHRRAHVLFALLVVEWRVLDTVPVDLSDIKIFFHFGHVACWDAVGCAPDSGWCGSMLGVQILSDLPLSVDSGA